MSGFNIELVFDQLDKQGIVFIEVKRKGDVKDIKRWLKQGVEPVLLFPDYEEE